MSSKTKSDGSLSRNHTSFFLHQKKKMFLDKSIQNEKNKLLTPTFFSLDCIINNKYMLKISTRLANIHTSKIISQNILFFSS